jgi:hypothetical protein
MPGDAHLVREQVRAVIGRIAVATGLSLLLIAVVDPDRFFQAAIGLVVAIGVATPTLTWAAGVPRGGALPRSVRAIITGALAALLVVLVAALGPSLGLPSGSVDGAILGIVMMSAVVISVGR